MSHRAFDHPTPDRFIVGTVGLPGERTFFLQARTGRDFTSVVLEKEQVSILADRVGELLDMVIARTNGQTSIPPEPLAALVDNGELSTPVEAEFRVGTMSLAWDTGADHLVVECFELTEEEGDAEPDPENHDVLRVVLGGGAAREFVRRAQQVVDAGRGDCPFCSQPLDPSGHLCPRANGVVR